MAHWFITGARRGIGLAVAHAAVQAGEQVTATGRDPEAIRRAIGSDRDRLLCLALDVRDREQASAAVAQAEATMGPIDVLVNNAGYSQMGIFEELPPDTIEEEYATNVFGTMNVLRAVLPGMRRARAGRVLNIASLQAGQPQPGGRPGETGTGPPGSVPAR
jgi:NAD(P)-dependent dehydrogenase (short-subunit alcohol dehydrogenase family)